MKKQRKNIDDFFKEELGSYTETPPPAAWDALEKKLINTPPKGPRFGYNWLGYTVVLLLLATLGVSLVRKINGDSNTKNILPGEKATIASVPATPVTNTTAAPQTASIKDEGKESKLAKAGVSDINGPAAKTKGNFPKKEENITASRHTSSNNHQSISGSKHKPHLTAPPSSIAQKSKNDNDANLPATAYQAQGKITKPTNETVETATDNNQILQTNNNETNKKEVTRKETEKKDNNESTPGKPDQKHKADFNRFEAGIKGGYERGTNGDAATKYVGSLYLQFNLSPKFSLMTQPAVKFSNVNKVNIGGPNSYYKPNNDTVINTPNGVSVPVYLWAGGPAQFYVTDFRYTQTHDSIVKSNTFGGTYSEYEFPLLLKYKLTKSFSLYGGVNVNYSKLTGVTEHTYIQNNISILPRDSTIFTRTAAEEPIAPPVSAVIRYPGTPYSSYTGPQYPTKTGGMFRFGYMLGFSYEYSTRWLFEALIQQTPTKSDKQAGYNINNTLSSAYFRFTLGYKLIK